MGLYRPEIDGLRAIAIVSVILFHTGSSFFSGGYVGVDIFFVISGFLITSIILNEQKQGQFSFLAFYERRARRILPAILFMLTLITSICFAFMAPKDLIEYGKLLIYTVLFGANFRLAGTPSYFATSSHENPLLHMWSLAVEEQFYLIWPALLFLLLTFTSRKQARNLTLGLLILSLVISTVLVWLLPRSAFYHLPSRGWELLTGAVLAMGLVRPVKQQLTAEAIAAAGLALMLTPVVIFNENTPFPGLAAIPPVLGCAMFIHAATFFETRAGAVLKAKPVVFIGLISYSLYLWHWPLMAIGRYVSLMPLSQLEMAAAVALAVVMSVISWRYVETPFRHRQKPLAAATAGEPVKLRRLAYVAVGITAVLVASGSFFQESRGAPWRLAPEVQAMLEEKKSSQEQLCNQNRHLAQGLVECKSSSSDDGPGEFVLWGDSHAEHYFAGTVAALGNGTILKKPACSPIMGVSLSHENGKLFDEECEASKQIAMARIEELKPKVVILAARWFAADKPDYVLMERAKYFLTRKEDKFLSLQKTRENLGIGLLETIRQLKMMGVKVAVLGQVPELAYDVHRCTILSHMLYSGDISRCTSVRRGDVQAALLPGLNIFAEIQRKNPDVSFYSPLDELCDQQACHGTRNGKMLYFDQNHLNRNGSLYLVNSIRRGLQDIRTPEIKTVNLQRTD